MVSKPRKDRPRKRNKRSTSQKLRWQKEKQYRQRDLNVESCGSGTDVTIPVHENNFVECPNRTPEPTDNEPLLYKNSDTNPEDKFPSAPLKLHNFVWEMFKT